MRIRPPLLIVAAVLLLLSACASGESTDTAVLSSTVDRAVESTIDASSDVDSTGAQPDADATTTAPTTAAPSASTTVTSTGAASSSSSTTTSESPEAPSGSTTSVSTETQTNDALAADSVGSSTATSTAGPTTTVVTTATRATPAAAGPTTSIVSTTSTSTAQTSTTAAPAAPTTARPTTTTQRPVVTTTTVRPAPVDTSVFPRSPIVRSGAQMLVDDDFDGLRGKRVGLIVNHVSRVGSTHLIDVFDRAPEVELVAIFGPEHGVRGTADAGEKVDNEVDEKTGTPILSLYGSTRKPTSEMLEGVDVLVFDLQDVGTRFYTYISTMGLAMQAAAAADIEFVVLDRPNPLGGNNTGGFTRLAAQDSFIGQYPIPSTYALTAGELAHAIKGERWMSGLANLDLRVIELDGWNRRMLWPDTGMSWIGPSPGLPTFEAALAYPGTVLLEATTVSYGTGTFHPFSTLGAPWIDKTEMANDLNGRGLPGVWFLPVSYTPRVIEGLSVRPRLEGELVHGVRYVFTDYRSFDPVRTGVHLLDALRLQAAANDIDGWIDRPTTFDLLSGNPTMRRMLLAGDDPEKIVSTWSADNRRFDGVRSSYELYR